MLDLPERPEYSHWGDGLKKDHRVSKVVCEFLIILFCSFYWTILIFLHLDKRDCGMGLMKGHQVRHPPFPRPDLVQYQMGYVRHLTTIGIVSYKQSTTYLYCHLFFNINEIILKSFKSESVIVPYTSVHDGFGSSSFVHGLRSDSWFEYSQFKDQLPSNTLENIKSR